MSRLRLRPVHNQLELFGPAEVPPPAPTPPPRVGPNGELQLPWAFRLERNLALVAGAGTGKTHSLVTLCLHLLAGARALPGKTPEECKVAPQALGLLTFTDKAAAEMRERLWQRVDALAHGDARFEVELRQALDELNRPMPEAAFWRRVRDELASAPIGTFHALCVQMLRRAPAGSGISAAFEVLSERETRLLLLDCAERVVLEALEADQVAVTRMVSEWNFRDERGFSVVGALVSAFTRIREEGVPAADLELTDVDAARAAVDAALQRCLKLCAEARLSRDLTVRDLGGQAEQRLRQFELATAPMVIGDVARLLANKRKEPLGELRRALNGDTERPDADLDPVSGFGLAHHYSTLAAIPYERASKALLVALEQRYEQALQARGALDFTAMLVKTRDLLRDDPHARAEEQARFGALLVDEFQDTNRLQLELLHLLAEERTGRGRPTTPPLPFAEGIKVEELPLEPGFVCIVGDRKQSIYEFRGSDVSVFEQAAKAIEKSGGGRAYLLTSRRSSPQLIDFFNAAFPPLMPGGPVLVTAPVEGQGAVPQALDERRPYVVGFSPFHDVLNPHRPRQLEGSAVELLQATEPAEDADGEREADAAAVAARVRELLDETQPLVVDRQTNQPRRLRGGDVALLFRRFTFAEQYRQALMRLGVPCRVVRGRGFFAAQEVVDLACLIALVADPTDAISLAAVLRSPLVGLSDPSLFALAHRVGGRLDAPAVLALTEAPAGFSDFERQRFEGFVRLHRGLLSQRQRLGARALLKVALDETGYREAMAGAPYGEQALANIDKLLELAAAHDHGGLGSPASFARELLDLVDSESVEAQAAVLDDADDDAVTLCTIHQAKGLEWPVVVMPDTGGMAVPRYSRLRFTRPKRLTVEGFGSRGVAAERARVEQMKREEAEARRLLYVALTRARDRLILGPGSPRSRTWSKALAEVVARPDVASLVTVLPAQRDVPSRVARASVDREPIHFPTRPEVAPKSATLPVTALQDFALCPRRYAFTHLVGLQERTRVLKPVQGDAPGDIRERGTAAHRLLELVPLDDLGTDRLEATLEALESSEGLPADLEVRGWVQRFLGTGFGRELKRAGEGRVHRELSFLLRLGDDFTLHLKGQIDLLVEQNDASALVVDYKTTRCPPEGLEAYRFQLGCYALAASHFLAPGTVVKTAIAFLRDDDPSPRIDEQPAPPPHELERWLVEQAQQLVQSQVKKVWAGLPRNRCEAIGCGYVARCHSV